MLSINFRTMTTEIDRLNSEDDSEDVDDLRKMEQLKNELKNVQIAFEEYISTTQVMEEGMEKELNHIRKSENVFHSYLPTVYSCRRICTHTTHI